MFKQFQNQKAQVAVEYMLLLALVMVIVLGGLSAMVWNARTRAGGFFDNVVVEVVDGVPPNTACQGCNNP